MIRLDLEIPAQKVRAMIQNHNQQIDEQIQKGIDMAIKELSEDDGIARWTASEVKQQILNGIRRGISSADLQDIVRTTLIKFFPTETLIPVLQDILKEAKEYGK
jgi:hypothetical protein